MRPLPLALACVLLSALTAGVVLACDSGLKSSSIHSSCCSPPARWGARHDMRDARIAIRTRSGETVLLLTDDVAAIQLSDRVMHKLHRKLRDEEDSGEDNVLAHAIKIAVLGGVRSLLDHSAECPIRDLRDVDYRKGRLILVTEDGDRVFDDIDVNDEDVMSSFTERDARAFVRARK